MSKTIVVGVGGTGLQAIRALRRRIVERKGSLSSLPNLGFLYIDTDDTDVSPNADNLKRWQVLGVQTHLKDSEYVIQQAPQLGYVVNNIDDYPIVRDWFPKESLSFIDQSSNDLPGARQIRPLGRFVLAMSLAKVEEKFKAQSQLVQSSQSGGTTVYIVTSLSGGTGSGMFIDLAYLVRDWLPPATQNSVVGFLVMPDMQSNRGDRYLVNAYAALSELNYVSLSGTQDIREGAGTGYQLLGHNRRVAGPPFDNCYLVGRHNLVAEELSLNTLPELIAHRIYLGFESEGMKKAAERLLNNGSAERVQPERDSFTGALHSTNFSAFGLAAIENPTLPVTEILAHQLVDDLVRGWTSERDSPANVHELAQTSLPDLRLTDDYLVANRNIIDGRADYDGFEREVEHFIGKVRNSAPQKDRGAFLRDQQRQFVETFRQVGLRAFFETRRGDLEGADRTIHKLLANRVDTMLRDPEMGYVFVGQIVREWTGLLTDKHQEYVKRLQGLPQQEKSSSENLTVALNRLREAEDKILPIIGPRQVRERWDQACDVLQVHLKATIARQAYEYGRSLLVKTLERIQSLQGRLQDWRLAVERQQEELQKEVAIRKKHLLEKVTNHQMFNGILLFSEDALKELYADLDKSSALRHLEQSAIAPREDGAWSLMTLGGKVTDELYQAALKWLGEVSDVQVGTRTVAEKLVRQHPGSTDRVEVLRGVLNRSAPFVAFAQTEMSRQTTEPVGYIKSPTTRANIVGLQGGHGAPPEADTLRKDLRDGLGFTNSDDLPALDTPHEMLFLQEITAFPLRFISEVGRLRDMYEDYCRKTEGLPLHIQKRFDPPLFPLFLTSAQEREAAARAEEAFLVGRVEQWIRLELNQREGSEEVRHRFSEFGSETFVRLGSNFSEAFSFVSGGGDVAKASRDRLIRSTQDLQRKLDSHVERRAFAQRLATQLIHIRATARWGEEDPEYRMWDDVRRRIVQRFSLPIDVVPAGEAATIGAGALPGVARSGAAVMPRAIADPAPSSLAESPEDVADRFRARVRVWLKGTKGEMNDVAEARLRHDREKLGVSEAVARRVISEVQREFISSEEDEYRRDFETFLADGIIDDAEREVLIDEQQRLGLTDAQVRAIESDTLSRRRP